MKLEEISEKEYIEFVSKFDNFSIYQHPNWGKLKNATGWDYYLVGLKNDNKLCGASLLLRKKVIMNLYLFYAPRGYMVDSKDKELLTTFHNLILSFIKSHKGYMLKIDPNVVYKIYDKDKQNEEVVGQEDLDNYNSCGFKHLGFTLNFETMQPRFLCRYKILDNYEKTLDSFSKSTRKNTEKSYAMGVVTYASSLDEIDLFCSLLNQTALRSGYETRPNWYYKKQKELFKDDIIYYISYLDTEKYLNYVNNSIKSISIEIDEVNNKIKKYDNVGSKLKNELSKLQNTQKRLNKELEEAKELAKEKKIYLGALISVFVGNEGITFSSGTDSSYKKFNVKYNFYDEHLKESIKRKKEYVNFYGISGDMNTNNPYYHIYEIKKGYNVSIEELIGEFDYIISKPKYYAYKFLFKGYKLLKKIKK